MPWRPSACAAFSPPAWSPTCAKLPTARARSWPPWRWSRAPPSPTCSPASGKSTTASTCAIAASLAIPTEHADVEMEIQDGAAPYSHFTVHGRSGDHELELEAQADPQPAALPYFATAEEGFDFLTHRLTGFATGRNGLSVVRVEHPHMHPLRARIEAKRADEWTAQGVLTPEEVRHPLLALIQPEVQFDMNLPERVAAS